MIVIKKGLVAAMASALLLSGLVVGNQASASAAEGPNRAWSVEKFQIRYTGTAEFRPNYRTTKRSGYGLKANRYVKKAYVNYTRNGKSITGGRKWTKVAPKGSTKIVRVQVAVWDNLLPGKKRTTKFHYGWQYR